MFQRSVGAQQPVVFLVLTALKPQIIHNFPEPLRVQKVHNKVRVREDSHQRVLVLRVSQRLQLGPPSRQHKVQPSAAGQLLAGPELKLQHNQAANQSVPIRKAPTDHRLRVPGDQRAALLPVRDWTDRRVSGFYFYAELAVAVNQSRQLHVSGC